MDTVSWRRNGLAYVLLANSPSAQLPEAGALLYESRLPTWSTARTATENG
jgi:hypothetical protein